MPTMELIRVWFDGSIEVKEMMKAWYFNQRKSLARRGWPNNQLNPS
jgi:hypothetical protein